MVMKFFFSLCVFLASACFVCAQEEPLFIDEDNWLQEGRVVAIASTSYPIRLGREIEFQDLVVELADGSLRDDVYNDYTPVAVGDYVYLTHSYDPSTDTEGLFVEQIDRVWPLGVIVGVFLFVYLVVGGRKGARSLIALVVAILSVYFVLLPALQAGYDPLWVGVAIAAFILGIAMFITHGCTIVSLVSYTGSMIAIVITVFFAWYAMKGADISGLVGNDASTLNLVYGPVLDTWKLLLAGMIIGILGVMDDVAVMQAAMVREFFRTSPESGVWPIFMRAMKVGREHAAALVNTLVLAYTAVALPLLLIVFSPTAQEGYEVPWRMHLSNELFVVELIRSIVGSFGLVLTVPIVTFLAVWFFNKHRPQGEKHEVACMHHQH